MIKEITASQLKSWQDQNTSFQLIDIREEEEIAVGTIGGVSIPMDQIIKRRNELRQDIPVVIHCNSGKRSRAVVYTLVTKYEMNNIYSLCGGIQSYAQEVNPQVLHAY
jgi:rhodanese-related sulfurtransferase